MRRFLKIIGIGLLFFTIGACLLIMLYDLVSFDSYRKDIKAIIQALNPLYMKLPKPVLDVLILSEGKIRIKSYVAQRLLLKFGRNNQRMLKWHIDYALWTFLIGIHFNDIEIFSLWCHFAPYEKGEGLNESANFYYRQNINQLGIKEIAAIVIRVRAPLFYKSHPEILEERVNDLLLRYRCLSR